MYTSEEKNKLISASKHDASVKENFKNDFGQMLNFIVDNSGDGIIILDKESLEITYCNNKACDLFGYPSDKMLKLKLLDLIPPESKKKAYNQILSSNTISATEYHFCLV